jgi:hypothetical protein
MSRAFKLSGVVFTTPGLPSLFDPSFFGANLVGWWAADQGVTANGSSQVTAWSDLSGAGNTLGNATPANSLTLAPASLNNLPALVPPTTAPTQGFFVQSTAAIASMGFNFTTPFTMFTVIKRQPTTGTQKILESYLGNNTSGTSFGGWNLGIGSASGNTVYFNLTGVASATRVHGSTVLVVGTAYEITVTYDGSGSASGFQIYVNGVAETMTVVQTGGTGTPTNGNLIVGGFGGNFEDADYVCEVAIMNAKATSSQLTSLHNYSLAKWNV